jgi:glycosyltransferase involved in cell wall biosynthesis
MSTLCYDKGTLDLIEAMRRLWATGRRASLVLAGRAVAEFETYWQGLPADVRRRIHRPGAVSEEEKGALFTAATCFAMPSRVDSFGIVFLEAWERSKPVIGARAWGIAEDVIHHERDGLLVPFGDVPALSDAITRLLDDPALAEELGRRGRRAVEQRYTWERAMATLLPLYEELGQSPS